MREGSVQYENNREKHPSETTNQRETFYTIRADIIFILNKNNKKPLNENVTALPRFPFSYKGSRKFQVPWKLVGRTP